MSKIICDKCGSQNISNFLKDPPPEPEPIKLSEFAKQGGIGNFKVVPAIMRYHQMIGKCNSCGYQIEYTSPNPVI